MLVVMGETFNLANSLARVYLLFQYSVLRKLKMCMFCDPRSNMTRTLEPSQDWHIFGGIFMLEFPSVSVLHFSNSPPGN